MNLPSSGEIMTKYLDISSQVAFIASVSQATDSLNPTDFATDSLTALFAVLEMYKKREAGPGWDMRDNRQFFLK